MANGKQTGNGFDKNHSISLKTKKEKPVAPTGVGATGKRKHKGINHGHIDVSEIQRFCQGYWSHPFWSQLREHDVEPWVRMSCLCSKAALKRAKEQGLSPAVITELTSKTWVDKFREEQVEELKWQAGERAARGAHVYYYVNVAPWEFQREHIRASEMSNVLWVCVDHDVRLPMGIRELYREAGIEPWMIIQTSPPGKKDHAKYQVLIAIDPAASRKFEDVKRVSRLAAHVFGSDPSVCTAQQIFRMPGTWNWKDAESGGAGRGMCKIVYEGGREQGMVYLPAALEGRLHTFGDSDVSAELRAAAPKREPQEGDSSSSYSDDRLFEVSWQDALASAHEGQIVAYDGERHNALISWASGLASGVATNRMSMKKADATLRKLGTEVCEGLKGDELESELKKARHRLRECVKRDKERGEVEVPVIEGKDAEVYADPTPEDSIPVPDADVLDVHDEESVVQAIIRDGQCHGKVKELLVRNFFAGVSDEWLEQFIQAYWAYRANTGESNNVASLLVDRCVEQTILSSLGFCVPITATSEWNSRVKLLVTLGKGRIGRFVLSELLSEATRRVRSNRELLQRAAGRGATRRQPPRVDLRDNDSTRIVRAALNMLETPLHVDEADNAALVVMQNGQYELDKGLFTPGDQWAQSTATTHFNFRERVWRRACNVLRQGTTGLGGVLQNECPMFAQTLRTNHPDDEDTWLLMLCVIGYCMAPSNPWQILFNFHGSGATGKSTMAELICGLAGWHTCVPSTFEQLCADKGGAVHYFGKNIVYIDEAESGDARLAKKAEMKLKAITGGAKHSERALYENAVTARIPAKFIFTTNNVLPFSDGSGALSRRAVVFEFNRRLKAEEQKADWSRKLLTAEADVIGTLAVGVLGRVWGQGRSVFERSGSRSRAAGKAAFDSKVAPIAHYFDKYFEITGNKEHGVPTALIMEIIGRCMEEDGSLLTFREQDAYRELASIVAADGGLLCVGREGRASRRTPKGRIKVPLAQGVRLRWAKFVDTIENAEALLGSLNERSKIYLEYANKDEWATL